MRLTSGLACFLVLAGCSRDGGGAFARADLAGIVPDLGGDEDFAVADLAEPPDLTAPFDMTCVAPTLNVFPTQIDFGVIPAGAHPAPRTVTLVSCLGGFVHVKLVALAGLNPDQFTLYDEDLTLAMGFDLARSKVIGVAFAPFGAPGARSASLVVSSDISMTPLRVLLLGIVGQG